MIGGSGNREPFSAAERLLLLAIGIVLLAVWLEPRGSWLAEPDEPRYAEIPREMLAAGDLVTPRLNGVPYFEKPPLLYWANAGSLRLFGQTPWAARLPTRLAGLATALLVFVAVARARGRQDGLAAAGLFLAAPFVLAFSRLNLTDGLLTLFFTATLLAGRSAVQRRASGGNAAALSALTGALAAAGFLSKGLVALVLPGGILVSWAIATRRWRSLGALLAGPAPIVFAALAAPWPWLAERHNPGFLQFFFIHEHFQRFATGAASRPGPVYYFVVVFLLGFLPGLPFFVGGLRRLREDEDALFFAIWFAVVLVFFSVSHSKLIPYLFPAFPAAAALAARGFADPEPRRGRWLAAAILSTLLPAAAAAIPAVRSAVVSEGIEHLAVTAAILLAAGGWGAWRLSRHRHLALAALVAAWGLFYVGLALIYPHTPTARDLHDLAGIASRASAASRAQVVFYRSFVQTFPWELKSAIPLADQVAELEPWWLPEPRRREIFWSREDFWKAWAARPLVAVARLSHRDDFAAAKPPARVIGIGGKYCLVTNVR